MKSTVEEIQARFNNDVDRFSNLEAGQTTFIDAAVMLELITESANKIVPHATCLLDIGCGAGNYTLKMLSKNNGLHCTLVDLSRPMLDRAIKRMKMKNLQSVVAHQGDIREVKLMEDTYDIILAGAVLHHLRNDSDWEVVFTKLFSLLKPGGCLMISDLVAQDLPVLEEYINDLYGEYLQCKGGKEYRLQVLGYIEKEDTPRSVNYQMDLMKRVGFRETDILHKNHCFAAFCGIK